MVLHLARKLAATVLGQDPSDPSALQELRQAGVPVSEAGCRTCADPCDEGACLLLSRLLHKIVLTNFVNAGHEEFSRRFDVDMETEMRGSVKPYRRQVSTSTNTRSLSQEF